MGPGLSAIGKMEKEREMAIYKLTASELQDAGKIRRS